MLDGFGFVVLVGFVHYVTCCVGGLLYCPINLLECCYASVCCDCAVAWHVLYLLLVFVFRRLEFCGCSWLLIA